MEKESQMVQLNPYLTFSGNCRDAMAFYQQCLGGELYIQTVGESPAAPGFPAEVQEQILHSHLTSGNLVLMAADAVDGSAVTHGTAITVCINSGTREETRAYFAKVAEGATITAPLQDEFFGMYGSLTDKFGIKWMFQAN
jgi:PhnB protein